MLEKTSGGLVYDALVDLKDSYAQVPELRQAMDNPVLAPDVLLDFDDNASLRTVRQEQVQIRALEIDLIWDLFTILDLHELIHSLELRQCAKLPLFYNLHKAQNFVWFCSYLI